MKMLRDLGLAVLVVCIAAFASGCGGGGGGGTAEEMPPPVMECPQGQVGTYPDCTDPGPTDEQRIAATQNTIAGVVTNARNLAQAANSAAAAVGVHEDATAAQRENAGAQAGAAQTALTAVLAASGAGNAATTPAAAEMALADARAELENVRAAQLAVAAIQNTVNAVAEARRQREADEMALTGGSSLIKHLRDNKKVSDAVLRSLGDSSIIVNDIATATGNSATYPFHTGTRNNAGAGVYPQPQDSERGVLGVTITVGGTGGEAVSSATAQTAKLGGMGRLSQGLDVKNSDNTLFFNAYTDIAVEQRVGTGVEDDTTGTPNINEAYQYVADPDYLLAGIWLNDATATPSLGAFAYGNENITDAARATSLNRCSATQNALPNTCAEATGFHQITNFVSAGGELKATYRGDASGAYLAGGMTSYFTADVELTAVFRNVDDTNVTGSNISGEVTNITAGGKSIEGSIDLIRHTFTANNIGGPFEDASNVDPAAVGVVAGKSYSGRWTGQFFGKRTKGSPLSPKNTNDGRDYEYQPDAPNSVAGTFYVIKQSAPAGDAAFLGSFGAYR